MPSAWIVAICTAIIGLMIGWVWGRRPVAPLRHQLARLEESLALSLANKEELTATFKALSAEALCQNNHNFLSLAKTSLERFYEGARVDLAHRQQAIDQCIQPIKLSLHGVEQKMAQLEKTEVQASAALKEQLNSLALLQKQLQIETSKIATALKATSVCGRWGEMQLRRVVELAGMVNHCDYFEQLTAQGEEGSKRPDLIVRLPGGKSIIVDAKSPLEAYLQAMEAQEEGERTALLKRHAEQIRTHIRLLASKGYTQQFQPTPEFVVLFLPGDVLFISALMQDPMLVEMAAEHGIILATPSNLIALLRTVYYGWRHETLSENAQKLSALAQSLYQRLSTVSDHWTKVGKSLDQSVKAYNEALSSFERRLLVTAREFERLDPKLAAHPLTPPSAIDHLVHSFQAVELNPSSQKKAGD